jgi:CelD/BcsL family acetyltransferase involved in cellulose biosynthesis
MDGSMETHAQAGPAWEVNEQFVTNVLTDPASIAAMLPAWQELFRSCGDSVFQSPAWHAAWWQHLADQEGRTPHVVTLHQGEHLAGIASLAVGRRHGLRVLEWAGTRAFDYPDILLRRGIDRALFWDAIRRSPAYDVADLRYVRSDSATTPALNRFAQKCGDDETIYAIHPARPDGAAWFDTLPRSARREHREKVRALERTGPVTLHQAASAAEAADMVDTLLHHKLAWAMRRSLDTAFTAPGMAAYLKALAAGALQEGVLHLTALRCGGLTLSTHLGFTGVDGFYYYVSAYDPDWGQLSPGRIHMNLLVMWAFDHGCHRFDFLRGDGDYKARLGVPSRRLARFVFARGAVGNAALQLYLWRERWRNDRWSVMRPAGALGWARSLAETLSGPRPSGR